MVSRRFHRHLPAPELLKFFILSPFMELLNESLACSASIERHHQTRLLCSAPKARKSEAEGASPPLRRSSHHEGMVERRFPYEGAIGKYIERARRFFRKKCLKMIVVIFFAEHRRCR